MQKYEASMQKQKGLREWVFAPERDKFLPSNLYKITSKYVTSKLSASFLN